MLLKLFQSVYLGNVCLRCENTLYLVEKKLTLKSSRYWIIHVYNPKVSRKLHDQKPMEIRPVSRFLVRKVYIGILVKCKNSYMFTFQTWLMLRRSNCAMISSFAVGLNKKVKKLLSTVSLKILGKKGSSTTLI